MFGLGDALDANEAKKVYADKMKDTSKTLENVGLLNQYDFTKQGKGDTYNVVTKGGDTNTNLKADVTKPTAGSRDETITSGGKD